MKKDPAISKPLLLRKEDLIETVRRKVRNEELKDEMLSHIDTPGFDEDILNEFTKRYNNLIGHQEIDWEKIHYESFQFMPDTLQTLKYEIESGYGFLYFSYEGVKYRILVDKMAKLVCGWRTREFGQSYKPVK